MFFFEREEGATVLKNDAGVARNKSAAEIMINGLDDRHEHAVFVDRAKIAGIAIGRPAFMRILVSQAGRHLGNILSPYRVDQPATLVSISLVYQARDRDVDELWIGQPFFAIGKSDLHG